MAAALRVSSSRSDATWLWIAAAVSLVVSLTPWAPAILYPFKLFTTWVHECGHALATVFVGGQVTAITIHPDTSGLTHSLVPQGRIAAAVVASAGYLGAAIVGCLLMAAARLERRAHAILLGLGSFMILTTIMWMRNLFAVLAVLAWAGVLIGLARQRIGHASRFLLSLLAIQVALHAVYDIRVLFLLDGGPSDAATMARLFLLPPWVWAATWMLLAVTMLGSTVVATRRRR